MKRYHITLGASTTAGGKVITASSCCSIDGVKVAVEGDKIICPACKSQGSIRIFGPRIPESWNGKQVALQDDLCVCKCPSPPKLVANQSLKCQVVGGPEAGTTAASPEKVASDARRDSQAAAIDKAGMNVWFSKKRGSKLYEKEQRMAFVNLAAARFNALLQGSSRGGIEASINEIAKSGGGQ
jgi:uncharacterized Zn-binding protein involved in type VI secretion